jgi:hypothetical protein
MRMVVDSNQLGAEGLRTYLSKSRSNFAVLTDYAAMEAYKGDTIIGIYKSMGILGDYPGQIIILKGTSDICGLCGRGAGLQRRLIDQSQTRGFPEYLRRLGEAKRGNLFFRSELLELGKQANDGIMAQTHKDILRNHLT